MYRQLWFAIIISTLLALTGSMLASLLSARSYLESQLSIKNSDNATALALSLSQSNPEDVTVDLVVAALFDAGHYELIRINDPKGRVISQRNAPEGDFDAPVWFVRMLPIHADAGQAQISNGWKQYGTVTLVSHSRFAYGALWKSAYEMAGALAIAGLIGGYLGSLVIRRLRKPLTAVIEQAEAIAQRRFIQIAEPAVPELRQLAMAMNTTVGRLKTMFEEAAQRLEAVRKEANNDHVTGLANRSYFLARLREMVASEEANGGTVFIARLANLAVVNQKLGRNATDELLRAYGKAIGDFAAKYPEALAARLNGADFALLLPSLADSQTQGEDLLQTLTAVASSFLPDQPSTWLAGGNFSIGMEIDRILSQVDTALAGVQAEGRDGLRVVDMRLDDESPRSTADWAILIERALEQNWVRLVSFPVVTLAGQLIHRECPLRLIFEKDGEWQPAGKFLPLAERLRLTHRLDLAAVELGLDELEASPLLAGLAINLSASSLENADFRKSLSVMLRQRSGTKRLWLEVAESGALSHFAAFRDLCADLRGLECKIGIEHFGRQFSEVGRLHDLGLDYIKVDASFIRGVESNPGNQAFLKGLSSIAKGIGLQVLAEGVTTDAELLALRDVGFDGATGPAIKEK
jgi:EAL domain-containing protein (putative c-di-GMP-specific phosphodiesterase class I)/GGDEF domain-containing protein